MSLIGKLFGLETKVVDASDLTYTTLSAGQTTSKTGLPVNEFTALRVSTAYACCRVLTEDVGKLPIKLMKESPDGSKKVAKLHPLHKVLSRRPNEWQTSMEWRMLMLLHALLGRGGYSYISRGSDGYVAELIPMLPGSLQVKQDSEWTVSYVWTGGGKSLPLRREDVHALHGMSWDGLTAMPVTLMGKEALGLAMATEETQARLHGQGARPGGIVSTDAKLGKDEVKNIKDTFREGYTGVDNAFKTLLLDNGLTFKPWAMTGVDGQHLQTRKYQVEEVCRFFRVFPSMIGYSDKAATYASAEAFFGAHVVHSLLPWIVNWEQAMERDLLSDDDQDAGFFVKFFFEGLLRGSAADRATFYQLALASGWMNRNEVRRLEDLNPEPGLDKFLTPMAMTASGAAPGQPGATAPKPTTPAADDTTTDEDDDPLDDGDDDVD